MIHETIALGCTVKRRSTPAVRMPLASKQSTVASVIFVSVQAALLDNLGSSS